MNVWERWIVHFGNVLVGGTGLIYAWMLYLLEPVDEFSVVHHPWQPAVQHAHIWVAPLLVFSAGLIWRDHIWKHWKQGVGSRRRSGLSLLLSLVPMVVSGYLIQTSVNESWRGIWVGIHVTTSVLWLVGYFGHFVPAQVRRRARAREAARNEARSPAREPASEGAVGSLEVG
jgi:hypothetical protein